MIPLSFLRKLDSLKYTSIVALVSIGYLVVLVVYHFASGDTIPDRGPVHWFKWQGAVSTLSSFPVIVFAYTCHQNVSIPAFPRIVRVLTSPDVLDSERNQRCQSGAYYCCCHDLYRFGCQHLHPRRHHWVSLFRRQGPRKHRCTIFAQRRVNHWTCCHCGSGYVQLSFAGSPLSRITRRRDKMETSEQKEYGIHASCLFPGISNQRYSTQWRRCDEGTNLETETRGNE